MSKSIDIVTSTKEDTAVRLASDKTVQQMVKKARNKAVGVTLGTLAIIGISAFGGWVANDAMDSHYASKSSVVATSKQ